MLRNYRKYYTAQLTSQDCGVASFSMILKYYNSSYPLEFLNKITKSDSTGTSILGIIEGGEELGLRSKAFKADENLFNLKKIPFPFIAHMDKGDSGSHYYVVFQKKGDKLIIGDPDPDIGLTTIDISEFSSEWDGISIFFDITEDYHAEKHEIKNKYFELLMPHKRLIARLTMLSFIIALISILSAYFLQVMIDYIIPISNLNLLWMLAGGLIIAYVFNSLILFYRQISVTVFGQKLSIEITLIYIHYLFSLPTSFFISRKTGELVSRFNDSSKITDALGSTVISIFLDFTMVIFTGCFLFIQDKRLFLISLISLPLYCLIILIFGEKFNKANYDVMEKGAILDSSVIENLTGIETIKSLNGEEKVLNSIDGKFYDLLNSALKFNKATYSQEAIKIGVDSILNTVVLSVGGFLVTRNRLSIGELMGYTVLLNIFTNSLQNIVQLQPKIQTAYTANQRLNEIYFVKPETQREITAINDIDGDINVDKLSFGYELGNSVLSNINLHIRKNSKIAIVGMSGSGKTTFAKILIGFLDADDNSVLLNGKSLNSVDRKTLRSYIKYVSQKPSVFSGTIRDNLTLGTHTILSDEDIFQALKIVELYEDISKYPRGIETELSVNDTILSEGQKQRLAIARAILSESKVLIFDESTSNLDTITEQKIIEKLLLIKDKTIIFIAHRLTIAKQAEYIVVLEGGSITEYGTHEELIKLKNRYFSYFI